MKKYFILLLLLCISSFLAAQQKHLVEAKETLYGLSKKYKVTIEELRRVNPQLKDRAPQIGETLLIPGKSDSVAETVSPKTKTSSETSSQSTEPATGYTYITVEPKETLYGLSKKYNTSIETIKKLNPKMNEKGPKIGEVLKIPGNSNTIASTNSTSSATEQTSSKETPVITTPKVDYSKGAINIVMFLPFHTETSGNNAERDIATQFYSGAQIALDSLSNRGRKINVKLLDSGNENKFRESLTNYDFSDTHLVIGPLFKSDLIIVADKLKKIPIVSPFSSTDELDGYENIILYDTKEQILAEQLVTEMMKKYSGEKVYILYDDDHYATALYFQSSILNKNNKAEIILTKNPEDIKSEQNLVTQQYDKIYSILVSGQDSFITKYLDVITKMESNQIQPISLFYSSLFDNRKYDSKLLDFGLIYSDTNYVNEHGFNEQKTINFYKKKYCNAPGKYAVAGFDVTYDVISRMNANGGLSNSEMKVERKQLSNKYSFLRVKKNGAWANQGARIIQLLK